MYKYLNITNFTQKDIYQLILVFQTLHSSYKYFSKSLNIMSKEYAEFTRGGIYYNNMYC